MSELHHMYRALRRKKEVRAPTALIEASYEKCRQCFEDLCIIAQSNSEISYTAIGDSYGNFLTWANDSGASSRTLDYTLRKSSRLSEKTLDLLKTLKIALQEGIENIEKAAFNPKKEIISTNWESDITLNHDLEIPIDSGLTSIIGDIEGTVGCLVKLLPNLSDPFPANTYSIDSSPRDADPDIDLAATLFPTATQALLMRLGWANWRRRLYLNGLSEKRKMGHLGTNVHNVRRAKNSTQREIAVDAFNFSKPSAAKLEPKKSGSRHAFTSKHAAQSDADDSSSIVDSVFSKPAKPGKTGYNSTAPTSVAGIEVFLKQQTIPKPPIPLDLGHTFRCPYCNDEIDVGVAVTTEDDWKEHVFRDVEPYMCTFDDCLRADKTFGIQDEWFRHELESHRIMKVWVCQACQLEFTSAQSFESHLQNKHESISGPTQLKMMVSLCLKHSETKLTVEVCPLCGLRPPTDELKEHIAVHLEQFALTSISGDGSSEDDDSDEITSQRFDDNMSEGRTKMEILNDFVEEQLGYMQPEKRGPADRDVDESNFEFAQDSDDEDSERQGRREWKVAAYLENKTSKTSKRERSRGRLPMNTIADSIHSSTGIPTTVRTVAHSREADFVGRDNYLATLYKILSTPGNICTLSGTGGIGKTATAIEYTFRYEQAYSYIFWTQAETRVGAADTFSLIASALGLAPDDQDQRLLVESSREFLDTTEKRWLLVFDNVDKWSEIEEYIPLNMAKTNGAILITTRMSNLEPVSIPKNFFQVEMSEMSPGESQRLLIQSMQSDLKHEKVRFHPEYKIAGEIASLARLPLAMSQIAGYVKASGCSLAEFLELWNEWRTNSLSARPPDASSNATLETIWSIGLSDLGSDALKLLKIMAFFDSDGIQRELLMNTHSSAALRFLHSSGVFKCRRMIADLKERKLASSKVQSNKESFSVHRLLQHRILQDLDENPQEGQEIFGLAFDLIRERLPRPSIDNHDTMNWNIFKEFLPHVLTIQRIYDSGLPTVTPFVGLAELFRDGGVHLWQRGIFYDALRLLKSAEGILDQIGCEEDQLRIDIHIAAALVIQYFGISHREESKYRFSKILEIRKKMVEHAVPHSITKFDEMTLCNSQADYANALLQFNDFKEAQPIYQQTLAKYKQWGSEDEIHFEYAKLYHHMAYCQMYQKDFVNAIELATRAVELVSRQVSQLQLTLRYKFDLACIILQSGDVERSLEMQIQILNARLHLQGSGKASYFTLQSYYAVGASYAHLERWDEAEKYMRTALAKAQERADKGFWPEAAVARTEFHLSRVLRRNEKDEVEAESLSSKAKSVLSRLLPYDPLNGVLEEHEVALFDHLQPAFGGRFTGRCLLQYVS